MMSLGSPVVPYLFQLVAHLASKKNLEVHSNAKLDHKDEKVLFLHTLQAILRPVLVEKHQTVVK